MLAIATLAGCPSPAPRLERAPLRIGLHSAPYSLDPHGQNEVLTFGILRHVYEALTAFDADMKLVPSLAASWENPSDLVWRFHLRAGVRFHDGRALTAGDVVAGLERARHPRGGQNFGSYLVAVDTVRALDAATVEVTTRQPYPILLHKLAFVLIPPAGSPDLITRPVGTGPYRFVSYAPGEPVRLTAFRSYWGAAPAEPEVEIYAEPDAGRRFARLATGELDAIQDPTADQAARPPGGVRILERESLTVTYLQMHPRRPPFDDARVRHAVDLALDRAAVVARSERGRAQPLGQMAGRNTFGFDPTLAPVAPDLPRARALLAAAGHPGGFDVDLATRAGRNADEIARQLAAIGIRARVVAEPWATLYPRLMRGEVPFYFGGFVYPSADASDYFDAVAHTHEKRSGYGDNNHVDFSDPVLDGLIERSSSTLDMLKRRDMLAQAMRRALEDMVYAPVYAPFTLFGARQDLHWRPRLDGLLLAAEMRRDATPAADAPANARPAEH